MLQNSLLYRDTGCRVNSLRSRGAQVLFVSAGRLDKIKHKTLLFCKQICKILSYELKRPVSDRGYVFMDCIKLNKKVLYHFASNHSGFLIIDQRRSMHDCAR